MVIHNTDAKNGLILSAGWAVLVAYIIAIYAWTDTSCDMSRASLVWTRQRANILLGVNESIDPCENIYNNSCDLYLKDSVGPFYHAALKAEYYLEQNKAYKACTKMKPVYFDDGEPRVSDEVWRNLDWDDLFNGSGDGEITEFAPLFEAIFMQDCALHNLYAEVLPVDNEWHLVIDSLNGSDGYTQTPDCLGGGFLELFPDSNLDENFVLFGDSACDHIDTKKGLECTEITSCKDYVSTFFPESLSDYAHIDNVTEKKLVDMMHEVYNTSIKIHFGGGKHSVRDAEELGAPVQILRQDRKRRELELIGSRYETSWYMPGTEVNAYYTPSTDEVFIAGGLLTEPFYHKDYPYEHNLAGLGFVIAHEIGHSFGPRAAKRWGRLNTTSTMLDLEKNLTLLANHSGKGYGSELYADYRGAQAINALVRVPTKLFFHHMAQTWCQRHQPWLEDPHPPSYWRVTMALNSMSKFRAAFGCEDG